MGTVIENKEYDPSKAPEHIHICGWGPGCHFLMTGEPNHETGKIRCPEKKEDVDGNSPQCGSFRPHGERRRRCCIVGCEKEAEWEIWEDDRGPEANTDACTGHVGELLTDAPSFRIYPVKIEASEGEIILGRST